MVESRSRRHAYVFAVVGERHVAACSIAVRYLRQFSRAEILLVQSRAARASADADVIEIDLPDWLDDHEASIFLKTNLLRYVAKRADRYCYLDSDVIAVRDEVDAIFEFLEGPVRFAADHVDLDRFSSWAVHCGCPGGRCNHLREAIFCAHGIDIRQIDWQPWNGGVFLFDETAAPFMESWHAMAMDAVSDPYWRTRDQGALAATVWKMGLEQLPVLPPEYNFIVDRMWGVPLARRAAATVADYHLRDDYSLVDRPDRLRPRLIHFVNGGVGRIGWRHWDEVAALLDPVQPARPALAAVQ